jgi:hypothetical protein
VKLLSPPLREIVRRPPANSPNPVRNSHFRSRHSFPPLQTYIRRRLFHSNGCSLLHAADRLGSRRLLQAPPGSSRQPRRSLFAIQSVPTGCRASEAFWPVYIARQSSPGLIEGQAIQRSFLQHNPRNRYPLSGPASHTDLLHNHSRLRRVDSRRGNRTVRVDSLALGSCRRQGVLWRGLRSGPICSA